MSGNDRSRPSGNAPRQSAAWVDSQAPAGDSRIGESRLIKGGSRIVFSEDRPPEQERPEGRSISEAEIAERGLLQERVIEIGEMREEAVVSKQAVVREELVVRKDVEERTERIDETLRRTEVDVEEIEPGADQREARGPGAG